jgi:hypothetical protein
MKRIAWEPVAAGFCALGLGAALTWYWLIEFESPRAPVPGHSGSEFQALSAAMPPIGPFTDFYVNDDNPFVPYKERQAEKIRLRAPPATVIKARPEVTVKPITPPVLKLPPKAKGGGDAPKVVGFTSLPDGSVEALVNLPGESRPKRMKPGEQVGRWTFLAIEGGNVALFADESGRQYRQVIGGR